MTTHQTTAARSMPAIVIAAAAALALAVVMIAGSQGGATAEESETRAPMGPRMGSIQERAHGHADVDPEHRAAHLAELAADLGVDADALAETMAAVRSSLDAQRATMHEDLAGLDRDARRAAMTASAEERRGLMAEALAELGVDPDAFAQHRADHDHSDRSEHAQRQQRGPQGMAAPHGRA